MTSSLAIDIGNSRTKIAIFQNGALTHKAVWEKPTLASLQTFAYNQNVEQAILSSTADVPKELRAFLENSFFFLELTHETPLPFAVRYATPHTLGKDRIAAAAGAFQLFPGENCLVIDAGTCITLDLLYADGEFLGGNISPGVEMRLKAMHHFTAKLPLVKKGKSEKAKGKSFTHLADWLGTSTENAMRNGAQLGAALEIQAFIALCRRHFRPLKVVLTGGDADLFGEALKTKIFARPNLVLEGLHKILQHNVQNHSSGAVRS